MELISVLGRGILTTILTLFLSTTFCRVLSQSANDTNCDVGQLSCADPSAACEFIGSPNEQHGAALCQCPESTTPGIHFCYRQAPDKSQKEHYKECKWTGLGVVNEGNMTETSVSPPTCDMNIKTFCPTYGPLTGGTNLFIWGRGLMAGNRTPTVNLHSDTFSCNVIFSNSTFIHCITAYAANYHVQESFLGIEIDTGSCTLKERSSYTYRYDPTITSQIDPPRSTLSGGLPVHVTGDNLASASRYLMVIRALYKGNISVGSSLCKREEFNKLVCNTPSVDLKPLRLPEKEEGMEGMRRKRQIMKPDKGMIKLDGLSVYAGFKVDGVTSLNSIQEWQLYEDPTFEEFPDGLLKFKPGWPDFEKNIRINGIDILSGVSASDYEVKIGGEICGRLNISDTWIICSPPSESSSGDPNPSVSVHLGNLVFSPGVVNYLNVWNNSKVRYAIIGTLAVIIPLLICLLVFLVVKCKARRKKAEKESLEEMEKSLQFNKNDYLVGDYLHPRANLVQALPAELRGKVQSCILHTGRVDQTDIKSRGNRGGVYIGWLLDEKGHRMMSVDIKTYKDDNIPFRDLQGFLEDAVKLRGLNHPNIQRLIGLNIVDNVPKALTPVSEYGDLKAFLHRQRLKQEGHEDITPERMMKFARDIANGMDYLSNLGYVHEDLAARNCVVDKDYVAKVSDAALSMDIYELDYWRAGEKLKLRPVKWMSPESLLTDFTSTKSDVWSYGVTLWEMYTLGATPYPDVDNADMPEHLKAGHRLSKPDNMPVSLYAEMTHCWAKEPNKRPTFKTLYTRLGNPDSSIGAGESNLAFNDLGEEALPEHSSIVAGDEVTSESNVIDIEHASTENINQIPDTPADSTLSEEEEDIPSRPSSEVYAEIDEENIKVEVEPTKMSDDDILF